MGGYNGQISSKKEITNIHTNTYKAPEPHTKEKEKRPSPDHSHH